ncbi:HNH endonuclease [Robbsia andropogonis]|uniref:HNH endonuclease n=1 Tax=Robbsia andropogonis TaxID=28092 RepID=UPI002A6A5722|nr:HNH endonuclease [Robbsia andropogonis]
MSNDAMRGVVEVSMARGVIALIDEEDSALVFSRRWYASNWGYAKTSIVDGDGKKTETSMHRFILGLKNGDGKEVDHINGNRLDNRRINLRICSHAENIRNRGALRTNNSGYKGVYWVSARKKWRSSLWFDGKFFHVGYFTSPQSAYEAYCIKAKELHGDFANLGVPMMEA